MSRAARARTFDTVNCARRRARRGDTWQQHAQCAH